MSFSKRRVAITGLGSITPLGQQTTELWENLLAGKSGIGRITRFDPSEYACQIAGEIKDFDPSPFIDKRDLRRMDLFTQYAIVAAEEAVKDAGISVQQEDPGRIGVVIGSGMGGMTEVEEQVDVLHKKGPRKVDTFFIPKLMINAVSAQLSIRYGFKGPNFVVSAACASGAVALTQALRMIQYGEADAVLCGGSEAVIVPMSIAGFCSLHALSQHNAEPQKASRPFDKERDGFVMGEGAGILVLEEMERAKKRGAKIYAEFAGAALNGDAYHITQPEIENITKVMQMALQDAGASPEDIDYVNAHGTSTKQNDSSETKAIRNAFGTWASKLSISSTKSMIGHLIGGAGAVEAIVSALSVYKNAVHPTLNYEIPDPECDLDYVPQNARQLIVRKAISNSFGFGGHNVSLVFSKVGNG